MAHDGPSRAPPHVACLLRGRELRGPGAAGLLHRARATRFSCFSGDPVTGEATPRDLKRIMNDLYNHNVSYAFKSVRIYK